MKSFGIVAVASLVALVAATPVEKRAMVVHTVVEEVTETVDLTTTVWVQATNAPHANYQVDAASTSVHHRHHHHQKPKVQAIVPTSEPYVAPEPVPTTPSTTSTSSTSTSSTSSSTTVEVPVYTPPPVEVAPTTQAPAPVPTTQAPVPEPTTQAPAPLPTTAATSPAAGASSGGACGEIGGQCSGDITYYEAGLGACGWTNDGSSEDVFALAHGMMGTQSNGNPFCGRMATIKVAGKPEVKAKLVDKCMGCEGQSIDLSSHLFNQLSEEATGRLHGVEWHFDT